MWIKSKGQLDDGMTIHTKLNVSQPKGKNKCFLKSLKENVKLELVLERSENVRALFSGKEIIALNTFL